MHQPSSHEAALEACLLMPLRQGREALQAALQAARSRDLAALQALAEVSVCPVWAWAWAWALEEEEEEEGELQRIWMPWKLRAGDTLEPGQPAAAAPRQSLQARLQPQLLGRVSPSHQLRVARRLTCRQACLRGELQGLELAAVQVPHQALFLAVAVAALALTAPAWALVAEPAGLAAVSAAGCVPQAQDSGLVRQVQRV